MKEDSVEINHVNMDDQKIEVPIEFSSILDDIENLNDLLDMETKYLAKFDFDLVKILHDKKEKLIRKLEFAQEMIKRDPSLIHKKNEEEKKRAKTLSVVLEKTLKENFREALKAKEVNKRIAEAVGKALQENSVSEIIGYNKKGNSPTEPIFGKTNNNQSLAINWMI